MVQNLKTGHYITSGRLFHLVNLTARKPITFEYEIGSFAEGDRWKKITKSHIYDIYIISPLRYFHMKVKVMDLRTESGRFITGLLERRNRK